MLLETRGFQPSLLWESPSTAPVRVVSRFSLLCSTGLGWSLALQHLCEDPVTSCSSSWLLHRQLTSSCSSFTWQLGPATRGQLPPVRLLSPAPGRDIRHPESWSAAAPFLWSHGWVKASAVPGAVVPAHMDVPITVVLSREMWPVSAILTPTAAYLSVLNRRISSGHCCNIALLLTCRDFCEILYVFIPLKHVSCS